MIAKHRFIYRAVTEAIEDFGDRHHLQARAHFAPLLGYRGPNGHVQVSGMLNHTTYNPTNPKRMSVDQLAVLLYELDEEDRASVLEAIVNEYGYSLCKEHDGEDAASDADIIFVLRAALGIDGVHGELAKIIEESAEDGEIDEDESERIAKAGYALIKSIRALMMSVKK